MDIIDKLFARMDAWRHFPNYQLERRADLLFSLYIPRALEHRFGRPFSDELIPEFPVRIGTIKPEGASNSSNKIDYVGLSEDRQLAVLVELKTDLKSRRSGQDKDLAAAASVGMHELLEGLKELFCATDEKRKYFHLLVQIQRLGLIDIPDDLHRIMALDRLVGAKAAARAISISPQLPKCTIMYLQPHGAGEDIMSFEEFRASISGYSDPIWERFAQSLTMWADSEAGEGPL